MTDKQIAIALVIKGDDVLMVRRRNDAKLQWQFPSGEIEDGETALQAAVREVLEETMITCASTEIIGERIHPVTNRLVAYVACEWVSGDPSVGDPEELDRAEWVDRLAVEDRIPTGLTPAVARLLGS